MIVIFGLGNPGKKFLGTRHNLGREVLAMLQKKKGFTAWQKKKAFLAEISQGELNGEPTILARSLTYMNDSGKAAKKLTANLRITPDKLCVVHDDADLALAKIKISRGRGSAGHKGIESIIKALGTKDFARIRIGIKPTAYNLKVETLNKFVLKKFTSKEKKLLQGALKETMAAIETIVKEGLEKAMQQYNKN